MRCAYLRDVVAAGTCNSRAMYVSSAGVCPSTRKSLIRPAAVTPWPVESSTTTRLASAVRKFRRHSSGMPGLERHHEFVDDAPAGGKKRDGERGLPGCARLVDADRVDAFVGARKFTSIEKLPVNWKLAVPSRRNGKRHA